MSNARRNELLEHRKVLVEEYQKHSEGFDKTIITLASASLGGSVALLRDIVPHPAGWTLPILFVAWLLLGFSLIAIVFSYLLAIRGREKAVRNIDLELKSGNQDAEHKISRTPTRLSWVSAVTLTFGIFFYLVFAIVNL